VARDYYAEARQLADDVRAVAMPELADRIDADIAAGFTATEILMRLRETLLEALPTLHAFPAFEARGKSLVQGIDEALGP